MEWIIGKPTKEGWYLVLLEKTPSRKEWFPEAYGKPVALYYDGSICGKWNDVCYYVSLNDIPIPENW